jgi:hypothetical protein
MSARWKHVVSYDCDERTEIDVGLFDFAIAEGFAAIEQNELSVGMGFSDAGRSPLKSGSSAPGWYKGVIRRTTAAHAIGTSYRNQTLIRRKSFPNSRVGARSAVPVLNAGIIP